MIVDDRDEAVRVRDDEQERDITEQARLDRLTDYSGVTDPVLLGVMDFLRTVKGEAK